MLVLTNTAAENAYAPSLYPSATTPVELEEKEGTTPIARGEDSVKFSPEALSQVAKATESSKSDEKKETHSEDKEESSSSEELTEDDKKVVEELKKRDQEVRTHEQAHVAAGGAHVQGGPTYSFQNGPDGRKYAVGGEVNISTSAVADDPDATIRKMQTVKAAAMAPAQPSGKDRSVASQASQAISQAQTEKSEKAKEERKDSEVKENDKTETNTVDTKGKEAASTSTLKSETKEALKSETSQQVQQRTQSQAKQYSAYTQTATKSNFDFAA